MRGQDDGALATHASNQLAELGGLFRVQPDGGFVEDQHLGVVQQGLRQADALPVAFGQRPYVHAGDRTEGEFLHDAVDAVGPIRAAQALQLADEVEIAADFHLGIQGNVLRHVAQPTADGEGLAQHAVAGHLGRARCGRQDAGQNAHGRRFAGPVRPEQSDDLAGGDGETHVRNGAEGPVQFGQAGGFDHGERVLDSAMRNPRLEDEALQEYRGPRRRV